ncbi:hypothetical protein TFUB22_01524 [Tannerella forsythia]|nr:hypothetical protein TFUB22_01524 [Tannerella forsythia]
MFVEYASMHKTEEFIRIGLSVDYRFEYRPIAFAFGGSHVIAEPKTASLQSCVEFVAVVGRIFAQVHDTAVQFAHILNDGLGNEASLDQIFQKTLRDPSGILHVTFPAGKLLDEIGIHQSEFHRFAEFRPYRNPIDGRALHSCFGDTMGSHVMMHLTQVRSKHSISIFPNNGLVISHNTEINAIFVHIKAGNCSSSVHNYFFKFFPSKIVKLWLRTRKGGDRKQSVGLVFLSARCKISRILSKFAIIYKNKVFKRFLRQHGRLRDLRALTD